MELRSGLPDPEPEPPILEPEPDSGQWRVSPPLTWAKIAAVVAFALVALLFRHETGRAVAAGFGAVLLGVYAARDLVAPIRLRADRAGVTVVTGYAGHRYLPWEQIERVRVYRGKRLGMVSEMLEIDAGESLHLFSTYDLNAPCEDVDETLHRLAGDHDLSADDYLSDDRDPSAP
jgi:hypothetical protein